MKCPLCFNKMIEQYIDDFRCKMHNQIDVIYIKSDKYWQLQFENHNNIIVTFNYSITMKIFQYWIQDKEKMKKLFYNSHVMNKNDFMKNNTEYYDKLIKEALIFL